MSDILTIRKLYHGRHVDFTGTVEELSNAFKGLLKTGKDLDSSIDTSPVSGEALVESLNKCVRIKMPRSCWTMPVYKLIEAE